jgi:hypothetical protein
MQLAQQTSRTSEARAPHGSSARTALESWPMSKSNSEHAPLEEPGKRSGEGSQSIVPHLQRQTQTQIKIPIKRRKPEDQQDPADSQPSLP